MHSLKPNWILEFEALLNDWKTHTLKEERAIQTQDWLQLTSIQESKEALMLTMESVAESEPNNNEDLQYWLAPKMTDLYEMEKKNADLLARQKAHVKGEIDKSRSSGRQLNQIKSAYSTNKESVMLQSYS